MWVWRQERNQRWLRFCMWCRCQWHKKRSQGSSFMEDSELYFTHDKLKETAEHLARIAHEYAWSWRSRQEMSLQRWTSRAEHLPEPQPFICPRHQAMKAFNGRDSRRRGGGTGRRSGIEDWERLSTLIWSLSDENILPSSSLTISEDGQWTGEELLYIIYE
jgi:hypothetical protein